MEDFRIEIRQKEKKEQKKSLNKFTKRRRKYFREIQILRNVFKRYNVLDIKKL